MQITGTSHSSGNAAIQGGQQQGGSFSSGQGYPLPPTAPPTLRGDLGTAVQPTPALAPVASGSGVVRTMSVVPTLSTGFGAAATVVPFTPTNPSAQAGTVGGAVAFAEATTNARVIPITAINAAVGTGTASFSPATTERMIPATALGDAPGTATVSALAATSRTALLPVRVDAASWLSLQTTSISPSAALVGSVSNAEPSRVLARVETQETAGRKEDSSRTFAVQQVDETITMSAGERRPFSEVGSTVIVVTSSADVAGLLPRQADAAQQSVAGALDLPDDLLAGDSPVAQLTQPELVSNAPWESLALDVLIVVGFWEASGLWTPSSQTTVAQSRKKEEEEPDSTS